MRARILRKWIDPRVNKPTPWVYVGFMSNWCMPGPSSHDNVGFSFLKGFPIKLVLGDGRLVGLHTHLCGGDVGLWVGGWGGR